MSSFTSPECYTNLISLILVFSHMISSQNFQRKIINSRSRSQVRLSPDNISQIMFNSNDQSNFLGTELTRKIYFLYKPIVHSTRVMKHGMIHSILFIYRNFY